MAEARHFGLKRRRAIDPRPQISTSSAASIPSGSFLQESNGQRWVVDRHLGDGLIQLRQLRWRDHIRIAWRRFDDFILDLSA